MLDPRAGVFWAPQFAAGFDNAFFPIGRRIRYKQLELSPAHAAAWFDPK